MPDQRTFSPLSSLSCLQWRGDPGGSGKDWLTPRTLRYVISPSVTERSMSWDGGVGSGGRVRGGGGGGGEGEKRDGVRAGGAEAGRSRSRH